MTTGEFEYQNPFKPTGGKQIESGEVKRLHLNDDVDSSPNAHHHTLGLGVNQAASGAKLNALIELVKSQRPVGEVMTMHGDTPPDDSWLALDGSVFDGNEYPELEDFLGTTTLPDYRDKFIIGMSGTKALGATGGSATNVIAAANLPPHVHTIAHTHNFDVRESSSAGGAAAMAGSVAGSADTRVTHAASAANSGNGPGSSTPLDIMPPWVAANFMIRAKNEVDI